MDQNKTNYPGMINKIIHVSLSTTVQTQTRTYNKLHEIFDTLDTDGLGVEKPWTMYN